MAEEWFRFYAEFIDDPKMKRFNQEEWGVWVGLLCLAEKSPTFGSLYIGKDLKYELSDICIALNNYDIEKLKVVLNKFQEHKMIDYDERGAINIVNFRDRQSSDHPKMVKERVYRFRNKLRNENETEMKHQSNAEDKIRLDKIRLDKSIYTEGFEEFWLNYPNKTGKGYAFGCWKKISPSKNLQEKIIKAVEEQKNSDRWKKENGQYIPNPSTWLNQKRWDDKGVEKEKEPFYKGRRLKKEGDKYSFYEGNKQAEVPHEKIEWK